MKRRALLVFAMSTAVLAGCAYTPPPVSDKVAQYLSNRPTPVASSIFVAIGDSYTAGSNMGGSSGTANNWVVKATQSLGADGTEVVSVVKGIGGSGYITRGPGGKVFGDLITDNLHPETSIAVFFGSINDQGKTFDDEYAAVSRAFVAARKAAPNAKLVAIGPAWMKPQVPADILAIRDAVAQAAAENKFTFIDPIQEGWFQDRPDLIERDGTHPTDAGHQLMADKIAPRLEAALSEG